MLSCDSRCGGARSVTTTIAGATHGHPGGDREGARRDHSHRVYGEPYERDGVVFIPAAEIRGGGGGGGGSDASKETSGSGGGYGINARPVGAYVVEGGRVRWEPAIDVTGIAVRAMVTALGLAFLLRRVFD
jgi:hypothetical protein